MRKFLIFGFVAALTGCSTLPSLNFAHNEPQPAPAIPVFFQPYSAALDAPALHTIGIVAQAAAAFARTYAPNARVIITGAADNVGSPQANKLLSETRAQIVADQLVADGISRHRIKQRGLGTVPNLAPPGQPAQSARRVLIQLQS